MFEQRPHNFLACGPPAQTLIITLSHSFVSHSHSFHTHTLYSSHSLPRSHKHNILTSSNSAGVAPSPNNASQVFSSVTPLSGSPEHACYYGLLFIVLCVACHVVCCVCAATDRTLLLLQVCVCKCVCVFAKVYASVCNKTKEQAITTTTTTTQQADLKRFERVHRPAAKLPPPHVVITTEEPGSLQGHLTCVCVCALCVSVCVCVVCGFVLMSSSPQKSPARRSATCCWGGCVCTFRLFVFGVAHQLQSQSLHYSIRWLFA